MKQRKMKFRAWDNDREEMIYDLSQCETIFWNNDEAMFVVAKDRRNGDWNELEVMEYTGLRDKNGAYIYEGDIVRWSFMVERVDTFVYSGNAFHPSGWEHSHTFQYEVIGNIHEHPHLLSSGN